MSKTFVVVDDDSDILTLLKMEIEFLGHQVRTFTSSLEALESIISSPPDCLLTDIMMPELDGVELCRKLRSNPALKELKIIVISGKIYQTDQQRALDAGADGFIVKQRANPGELLNQVMALLEDKLVLKFWGCRGTMPVPGPNTVKYGGNTSCVSLTFPDGHIFVFDAGTGIKPLGNSLMRSGKKKLTGTIFISHPHWDHINFFPFFVPLFIPGNQFTVAGSPVEDLGIEQLVNNQMGGVHFPITPREFGAHVLYRDIGEGTHQFGPAEVETMLLCHPGNCLGYSVKFEEHKICYVTDNELFPEDSDMYSPSYVERLKNFVSQADILITDTTYTDLEYPAKVGWGHSPLSAVCRLAHEAEVKELYLFHHDPDQDDQALEKKLKTASDLFESWNSKTQVRLAEAEQEIKLASS